MMVCTRTLDTPGLDYWLRSNQLGVKVLNRATWPIVRGQQTDRVGLPLLSTLLFEYSILDRIPYRVLSTRGKTYRTNRKATDRSET